MKRILTLLFCLPLFLMAQKTQYTTHTVGPKESLTSIGRMYNINGRELAKLNNIEYEKGLSLGQVLKVPKTSVTTAEVVPAPAVKIIPPVVKTVSPPVKAVTKSTGGTTPIYHTVGHQETLYGISVKYGKVPIADIKKWNNLTTDGLSEGSKIIVGYTNGTNEVERTPTVVPEKEEPMVVAAAPEKEKVPDPIKQAPVKEIKKEEIKKEVVSTPVFSHSQRDFNGGTFKTVYNAQAKSNNPISETGAAGVFKSTSGWEDGKYYCLHNSATAGTIIKVSNPATGKTIYAKVLDVIPDIKQNNGLLLRLSNAAADELGIAEGKFDCSVSYTK